MQQADLNRSVIFHRDALRFNRGEDYILYVADVMVPDGRDRRFQPVNLFIREFDLENEVV